MTTPDPAATLRAAAARLRALAAEATPGPWEQVAATAAVHVPPLSFPTQTPADAAWAAALGPQVAEPLAAWLESAAEYEDQASYVDAAGREVGDESRWDGETRDRPLAFARAVLGDAPADGEGGA